METCAAGCCAGLETAAHLVEAETVNLGGEQPVVCLGSLQILVRVQPVRVAAAQVDCTSSVQFKERKENIPTVGQVDGVNAVSRQIK